MKENWTYKKFSEVFNLQMGKTPSRDNMAYWGGDNIWVSIADLKDKYIESSKEYITDIAVSESGIKKVPQGTAIMSFKLTIGKAAITKCDLFTNEAIMSFEPKEKNRLAADYIYYYLKGCKWTGANKAVMGQTLNKKTISENIFAYPSIETQSRIVSELDLLQSIIDKQQAQLKELDTLSQAVFYNMFGDPVENEKGWEVKPLYVLCSSICGGGTPSKSIPSYWDNGDIPWVTSKDMKVTYIGDSQMHITKEGSDNSSAKILPVNSILMVLRSGILKHTLPVAITTREVSINQDLKAFILKKDLVVPLFFLHQIKAYSKFLLGKVRAVTADNIEFSNVKYLNLVLPSLSLQQSFADKIESIEKQKVAINQSIAETQKLFDYTMNKYFG